MVSACTGQPAVETGVGEGDGVDDGVGFAVAVAAGSDGGDGDAVGFAPIARPQSADNSTPTANGTTIARLIFTSAKTMSVVYPSVKYNFAKFSAVRRYSVR